MFCFFSHSCMTVNSQCCWRIFSSFTPQIHVNMYIYIRMHIKTNAICRTQTASLRLSVWNDWLYLCMYSWAVGHECREVFSFVCSEALTLTSVFKNTPPKGYCTQWTITSGSHSTLKTHWFIDTGINSSVQTVLVAGRSLFRLWLLG